VLSHVSEEGDTSEIDVASLSTLTHVATYIRGKVIAKLRIRQMLLALLTCETSCGTGKHWDPIFAKLSLLALLTCETSHPSNVPSK
jgi:hypothetical protein